VPPVIPSNRLQAWQFHPQGNVSTVAEEDVLSIKMSPSEETELSRLWPLASNTEMVKISYQLKFQGRWDPNGQQFYIFSLQDPLTHGSYISSKHDLQTTASWQTEHFFRMYKNTSATNEGSRLRDLPKELSINLHVSKAAGTLQLKNFRVEQFLTKVTVEHR
jgi:hypothetical protein